MGDGRAERSTAMGDGGQAPILVMSVLVETQVKNFIT